LSDGEGTPGPLFGIGAIQLAPSHEDGFPARGEEITQGGQLLTRRQRHK
jgi:hypothetical protein